MRLACHAGILPDELCEKVSMCNITSLRQQEEHREWAIQTREKAYYISDAPMMYHTRPDPHRRFMADVKYQAHVASRAGRSLACQHQLVAMVDAEVWSPALCSNALLDLRLESQLQRDA